ncbi:MAG: hypothetical protein WCW01_00800 [Gammaproteobacteria bacterium]
MTTHKPIALSRTNSVIWVPSRIPETMPPTSSHTQTLVAVTDKTATTTTFVTVSPSTLYEWGRRTAQNQSSAAAAISTTQPLMNASKS